MIHYYLFFVNNMHLTAKLRKCLKCTKKTGSIKTLRDFYIHKIKSNLTLLMMTFCYRF